MTKKSKTFKRKMRRAAALARSNKILFFSLLIFGLLAATSASAFESRVYGDQVKKTKINPRSKSNFPKALEIYNVDLTPHQDNSALIGELHSQGKRVVCFLSQASKPKAQARNIETAMNAGCDEVAVR